MKDIAPDILRQRLLIEGYYSITVTPQVVEQYLFELAQHLNLRAYERPRVFSPSAKGKPENQGYDAFMPLIDSGISVYVWSAQTFYSAVLFTCKTFSVSDAVEFTSEFFKSGERTAYMSF